MHHEREHFTLLNDYTWSFSFNFDGKAAESRLHLKPVPGRHWRWIRSTDRDSESLTYDPATEETWIGYEGSSSIRRYSPRLGRQVGWVAPPLMRRWPENAGPEAMVRLADGRFIVFSEEADGPQSSHAAVMFPGDPVLNPRSGTEFFYRPPPGYDATDAAQLPDGRVLVLNRHFSLLDGLSAALTLVDPRDIAPERIVDGRIVAILAAPLTVDNMEALSVERSKAGKVVIWIMSDDNFNPLQQTLLMKFTLDPAQIR